MARYMLVCRSVEVNPNSLILDKVGFVRYFATKKEALDRAMRWRGMKGASVRVIEVFAQVFDTKKRCWL